MKLHFNDAEDLGGRRSQKPLTLEEELDVVELIDNMLSFLFQSTQKEKETDALLRVQAFLNHYQNLCHHASVTNMQR